MKIRSQVGMVLNLDKCIGCHTCSVTCKNVWTSREGMEYAWFNNVESKPGIGYPKEWENQTKWNGGWIRNANGTINPRIGGKFRVLANIFANPDLPEIDDYYEPYDFDYQHLHTAPISNHQPIARPRSAITGKRMQKIEWGPNWEEILSTEFEKRRKDKNFDNIQADIYGQYENTFMMYLPRLCEHCLNPTCVSACPSGAIYKREEDGIVLIDQEKCRGWRMCISGCPYKKIYYNWKSGKSEKCIFCYPRIEAGMPTVCSETCVGRIRYLGVLLYDADKIAEAASTPNEKDIYPAQLNLFLDPNDPAVIAQALKDGVPQSVIDSAQRSPVYKLAVDWKLALPLHPEYRTLPMVWYVPPLSPIQNAAEAGKVGMDGLIPDVDSLRIPLRYLANLLTAGDEAPVRLALKRLLAMRSYKRMQLVEKQEVQSILDDVGLTKLQVEEMYRYLAIANFEDRFVIPTAHREEALSDAFAERGGCGFTFGEGCSGSSDTSMFGQRKANRRDFIDTVQSGSHKMQLSEVYSADASTTFDALPVIANSELKLLKVLSLLIDYPSTELFEGEAFAQCKQLVVTSTLISPQVRGQIIGLIDELLELGSLEAQSRYDGLFERGRSLSLWLFEHVHGESRDRGQAMVDLMAQYETAGFEIGVKELPDYLPMYLEFLAYQATVIDDDIQIRMDIADVSHIIALLAARLVERNSLYSGCFNALLQIAGKPLDVVDEYLEKISNEKRDDSLEAIDKDWEEEVVDFLGAQQEERCSSQTSTKNLAAQAGVRPAKAANTIGAPVHWVDFKQNPSVKQ